MALQHLLALPLLSFDSGGFGKNIYQGFTNKVAAKDS